MICLHNLSLDSPAFKVPDLAKFEGKQLQSPATSKPTTEEDSPVVVVKRKKKKKTKRNRFLDLEAELSGDEASRDDDDDDDDSDDSNLDKLEGSFVDDQTQVGTTTY